MSVKEDALAMVVEWMIDDLIEAGNGLDLSDAWRHERLDDLFMARDKPAEYLARERARGPK